MKARLFLILLLAAFPASAASGNNVDWLKGKILSRAEAGMSFDRHGTPVDPYSGDIISINRGRLNCYRKARETAVEKMVNSLKGLRVDPDNTVADLMRDNEITRTRVYDLIHDHARFSEFPVNYYSVGCRAELSIPRIISALPYTYPADSFPERMDMPVPTRYTSLIIDARGLEVSPMIFPVIYNQEGLEVYSRNFIDIRYAARRGMVRYVLTEKDAMKQKIAGDRPYFTVALKSLRGCPVLADRDVRKIFGSGETVKQLKKCRVIFIINREKAARK